MPTNLFCSSLATANIQQCKKTTEKEMQEIVVKPTPKRREKYKRKGNLDCCQQKKKNYFFHSIIFWEQN